MNYDTKLYKKKTQSPTWNYFKRLSPALAKCNICKKKLSFKTSISNLKRHLLLKHNVNLLYRGPKEFTLLDKEDNVKKLLNLVEQRQCLWKNKAIENTKFLNPDKKHEAWKEIASILCPEVDVMVAVPKLSERFQALKDKFFEDKLISGTRTKMVPSVYKDYLQFLNSAHESSADLPESSVHESVEHDEHMEIFEINEVNVKNEPMDESFTVKEHPNALPSNQGESSLQTEESSHWTERNGCSTSNQHPNADCNTKEVKDLTQYSLQLNNADKDVLFLLSLTEDMRRVPNESKTKFKGELMMTVSRLVKKYNQSSRGGY